MGTIAIRKTFSVAGTLTDVTSFTLGITRNDTGAVVVAAGTAMTRAATGTYTYSLTEPAAGLTYSVTFVCNYAGNVTTWTETVTGSVEETIPLPALTNDPLLDSLNSLIVERLRVIRNGSKPSYSLHGHLVKWGEYIKELDLRIAALRRELAAANPIEEIGCGF